MIIKQKNNKDIKFLVREGTSDEKTFEEVIVRNVYERNKDFKIKRGDHWIDLGGNAGAFAVLALSKGATVDIYEPDPFSCKMIEKNLKVNNFNANIFQRAVVANDKKKMTMYVGNNNQTWRNSLYKDWGNEKFSVDCIHYEKVIKKDSFVKMDIEGAEMDILEDMKVFPEKMVFEWSLDIDQRMLRYRNIVDKMKSHYENIKYNNGIYKLPDYECPDWVFPKADNVYCYE